MKQRAPSHKANERAIERTMQFCVRGTALRNTHTNILWWKQAKVPHFTFAQMISRLSRSAAETQASYLLHTQTRSYVPVQQRMILCWITSVWLANVVCFIQELNPMRNKRLCSSGWTGTDKERATERTPLARLQQPATSFVVVHSYSLGVCAVTHKSTDDSLYKVLWTFILHMRIV